MSPNLSGRNVTPCMVHAPPKSALHNDATPSRTTVFHDKMCHTASRCALVPQMRRTVSQFCVRPCLLFTVIAHVLPPLLCIREEKGARRWSSHRHFFEYLSPIPLLHHTLCSNDTQSNTRTLAALLVIADISHDGHLVISIC